MNLYKITFAHAAPKDRESGIKNYLIANSDEEVYEWIKTAKDPDRPTTQLFYSGWDDQEEEDVEFEIYDDEYNLIGTENFKERVIRLKGRLEDDDVDYSDAFYGVTVFGWELVLEDIKDSDQQFLLDNKIAFKA